MKVARLLVCTLCLAVGLTVGALFSIRERLPHQPVVHDITCTVSDVSLSGNRVSTTGGPGCGVMVVPPDAHHLMEMWGNGKTYDFEMSDNTVINVWST